MRYDWNAANRQHIALHGVTPAEAEQVIEKEPFDLGAEVREGEQRFIHLGETNAGRVLFVVATERGDTLRVVTAYQAGKKARRFYFNQKALNDGQDPEDPELQE